MFAGELSVTTSETKKQNFKKYKINASYEFKVIKEKLNQPVFIDLRNVYEPETMKSLGFVYHCIGR